MVPESGVVFPWEKAAINGDEMPRGLGFPEQMLFLELRLLYSQYHKGIIPDRDTAVREKKRLLDTYRILSSREKLGQEWAEQIRRTESARAAYRKDPSPENGMRLVLLLEGRNPQ